MDYAVVENGVVTNIIVASKDYVHAFDGEAIPSSEAQIGWTYKDGIFSPPIADENAKQLSSTEMVETDIPVEPIKEPQEKRE
ncbi:hypothetical protein [Bartonella henselae]|uniref:hypothetical protein n=1 Tax=Bartonella henselae TaxID=38323 RepID=UPI0003DF8DCB|nr:hypothetical protein [Bartonella henselae]ETS07676.1 hypothetical protein Q653_01330 [Bartonella henselae JK 42]ETS16479.1 hypothetical protein Q652_00164 [Bartonella henselae JK 41]KEC57660.1 hypothetical protein O97_00695 [Bartonella henselae str. Zeus]KEC63018.1 hypothetical protein O95_00627 [Bartonella henselae JK 53]MDM9983991.1 hypothetical protein [Bartonella henselae]